jgi:hypothetical protein
MQHEEAVARIGVLTWEIQVDRYVIVTETCVENRRRAFTGAVVRTVDRDGVITVAGPVDDAIIEITSDRVATVSDVAKSEPLDLDFGRGCVVVGVP